MARHTSNKYKYCDQSYPFLVGNNLNGTLINDHSLDWLYQIFIKSQIKFYRKCVEQGLSDQSIAKLMKYFTKQQKYNQK